VKTEVDSNGITECSHDDKPTIGTFGLFLFSLLWVMFVNVKGSSADVVYLEYFNNQLLVLVVFCCSCIVRTFVHVVVGYDISSF